MSEVPRRFSPLRRAPRSTRVALYILGPLLWVVALMVVSLLVHEQDAIETGLLDRRHRVRRGRRAAGATTHPARPRRERVCVQLAEILLAYVALFPVVTAGVWVAGGLLFRLLDESNDADAAARWLARRDRARLGVQRGEGDRDLRGRGAVPRLPRARDPRPRRRLDRRNGSRRHGGRCRATHAWRWCATRSTAARPSG